MLKQLISFFKELFAKQEKEETTMTEEIVCNDIVTTPDVSKIGVYERKDTPYQLSKSGTQRLNDCCKEIQDIVNEVLFYKDISITCGYRNETEQEEMFNKKTSKAHFGQSAHNYMPSMAIDFVPYPIPKINGEWDSNHEDWLNLSILVKEIAKSKNIDITWGGDFKSLVDKPHYEITGWKQKVNQTAN